MRKLCKLIKLDKAIAATWEEPYYTDPLNVLTEVRDRLRNLPTVEAIPIEWIEEYMDKLDSNISKYTINSMVHQWKAERKEE